MRTFALRHSIGTKIFVAFLAMTGIIAAAGAYGYYVIDVFGRMVVDTYDHPMMAINFARAASIDFLQMQNGVLRAQRAPHDEAVRLEAQIDKLGDTLSDDLDVADERSTAADERKLIRTIRALVQAWQSKRHAAAKAGAAPDLVALDSQILDRFDLLIELNADHGFVGRRVAMIRVAQFEDMAIGVTVMAFLLAGSLTIFLVRRIVRPLSSAALVADRIAAGEFETQIPSGGQDETGALLHSMQVMQDSIAAQMAREKARAQSAEGRLMDAIESSGEGVILADESGDIAVANSELARLFPAIADEIVPGRPLAATLTLIETQCHPGRVFGPLLADQLQGGSRSAGAERQLPDGRWLRISASGTREGGTILFFSDFTDIKAREERYRIAKQQAEAANAAKSRFLANMSHELRTPLNAVIGFSEILSSELYGSLGDRRYAEYSGDILKSGRHLLSVINSVLDLAKTESGNFQLYRDLIDLRDVLDDCGRMLHRQFENSGILYTAAELPDPVYLMGDEARLRQIFLNLLSNAVKFTERGGSVSVAVLSEGETVRVDVRDSGIGMSAADIKTALTPFGQVDSRLERRYEGTGLGLPLARAMTDLHGGSLVIASTPGYGTTVSVRLPSATGKKLRPNANVAATSAS